MILQALSGEISVAEACKKLGVGPTQYANLRDRMLQGALDAMKPRPSGRPSLVEALTPEEIDELEDELVELDHENMMLRAKVDANEALRAGGGSKRPSRSRAKKQRPRTKG